MVYNHWPIFEERSGSMRRTRQRNIYTICAKEMAAMKKTEEYRFLKEQTVSHYNNHSGILMRHFQNFFQTAETGFQGLNQKKNKNSYSTVCINGNITISMDIS